MNPDDLETVCGHEAAHAVMRWIRGLPATPLTITPEGGFSAGTMKAQRIEDVLLVTLAGFAWESGCLGFSSIDITGIVSPGNDFELAREILAKCDFLSFRINDDGESVSAVPVDDSLSRHFDRACELLNEYRGLVEIMGERLQAAGHLSARSVAAIIREWKKRNENGKENENHVDR